MENNKFYKHFKNLIMLRERIFTLVVMLFMTVAATAQFSVSLDGTDPTCNGFSNGTITANPSGGTAPFIYNYSNGFSGQTISGLSGGTFSVTVTDANNESANASITLNDPSAIEGNLSIDDVCSGDGNVSSAATGGAGGYSYNWSNGQTSANATGFAPGIACVTITDANGCASVSCTSVFAELTVDLTSSALPCFDACDASVTATVSGGSGPFSFIWNTGSTSSILEAVPTGTYTVTVTDNNGCTTTGTSIVGAPGQISIDVMVTNPQCGVGAVGSATVTATGGTPPYQYFFSDGQTGMTASNLPPGNYNVVVTDAAGCQEMQSFAIVPDGGFNLDISTTPTTTCGASDGTATVAASGGVAPYTYLWSTGGTTTTITDLAPGSYGVTVTDADGCATVGMATVDGLPDITLNTMGMDPVCGSMDGGTAIAQPFGGTPPYTYLWSNGSTTNVIGNLDPDDYTVTVTDAAGCTATATVTIGAASGSLDVSATSTGAGCNGSGSASATATVNGGLAPFTYSWSNGGTTATINDIPAGTYTVTVTDASGCSGTATVNVVNSGNLNLTINATEITCFGENGALDVVASSGTAPFTYAWSNGVMTAANGMIPAGQYSVTVTDAMGCTGESSATLTQPDQLSIDLTSNGTCSGTSNGSATVAANGGTAPYSYIWSTGATTASISNLAAGAYGVTVTDANGCIEEASFEIVENENPTCNASVTNPISTFGGSDGAVSVTASGGLAPYSYLWSTGATSSTINGLNAGTYTVTVTDQNGCTTTCSVALDNPSICDQVEDPGEICCDQMLCAPGNTPDPITSIAPATGGSGNLEYIWMSSSVQGPFDPSTYTLIIGATGLEFAPGPLSETTFFARCARREGCTAFLETNIVTIEVADDFAAIIDGPDVICVGETVTFSSDESGPGITYAWNFGSLANPSTATTQSVDVTWDFITNGSITLSVSNGDCTSTASLPFIVTDSQTSCGPGANNLVANVNDNGSVSISWDYETIDPSLIFTVQRSENGIDFVDLTSLNVQTNNQYTYIDAAPMQGENFYRVMMEESTGMIDFSEIASVEIANSPETFFLYPNPFTSELTISLAEEMNSNVNVNIFRPDGQVVRSVEVASGNLGQQLNMEGLASGIYYVQFQFAEGYRVVRVVKE